MGAGNWEEGEEGCGVAGCAESGGAELELASLSLSIELIHTSRIITSITRPRSDKTASRTLRGSLHQSCRSPELVEVFRLLLLGRLFALAEPTRVVVGRLLPRPLRLLPYEVVRAVAFHIVEREGSLCLSASLYEFVREAVVA